MTWQGLAWRSMWRKPFRTLLLIASVAVAFVIFGSLGAFIAGAHGGAASDERLVVANKAGQGHPLPIAAVARIAGLDGVGAVSHTTRLRAYVAQESNIVPASAVDPALAEPVFAAELGLGGQLAALLSGARDAAVVGRSLALAQGWDVGDRITLSAFGMARAEGGHDWPLRVTAIFDGSDASRDTHFLIFRQDYLNDGRAAGRDTVDTITVVPDGTLPAAALAPAIDSAFANSAAATRTQSEQVFVAAFLRQVADLRQIVGLVVGVSIFTILVIVGNTMAFAVRERTFEIGVLKTLGVGPGRILSLILTESLMVFAAGGALGLGLASALALVADPSVGLAMTGQVLGLGALLIAAMGLASGLLPAVGAMRLPVIATFRAR